MTVKPTDLRANKGRHSEYAKYKAKTYTAPEISSGEPSFQPEIPSVPFLHQNQQELS